MMIDAQALPEDRDELRAYVRSLQAELYTKTLHIEKLKGQLAALRRARFGRSSEKIDREIEQLELLIGEIEEGRAIGAGEKQAFADTPESAAPSRRERVQPVRRALPAHLPRERVTHESSCPGGRR